jgi:hypothetical protein
MPEAGVAAADAAACVGLDLDDEDGRSVGRIEALLADPSSEAPTWFVVRTRRFGRRATVPAATVAALGDRAWAPYSRETIRASSAIDCAAGLTSGDERALADHFGFPASEQRLTAIADREDADDGSVPVPAV